jgi:Ca2+-binding EF-hand superfamily protein
VTSNDVPMTSEMKNLVRNKKLRPLKNCVSTEIYYHSNLSGPKESQLPGRREEVGKDKFRGQNGIMRKTRTAVGRTNSLSRSSSRAEDNGEEGRATPTQLKPLARSKSTPPLTGSPASRRSTKTPQFEYDTPRSAGWKDEDAPPTPDFDEPEKVIEGNMTALKRCRHKLNVQKGGAKKYFLGWNTEHDGNLSRKEMYRGFDHLNLGFTAAQADFLVRAFDADASNSVEYHEFCQTMEMSDEDILKAVGAMSVIKPPPWIKPKGWKFNPHETKTIKGTQELIQQRMHQTFGGNPRDIRDAFLYMDKSRSGFLSKDDFLKAFARIGVDVKPPELDLLLASLDNEAQSHKIPYTNFVKNFESQPVGSFNPFFPTEKITGTEKVTQKQLDETGAPMAVRRKWSDSYGRDPRYRSPTRLILPTSPFHFFCVYQKQVIDCDRGIDRIVKCQRNIPCPFDPPYFTTNTHVQNFVSRSVQSEATTRGTSARLFRQP